MALKVALERVMNEWGGAHLEEYTEHPLARYIRGEATEEVKKAIVNPTGFSFKGSAGSGKWADVPWIAVFDDVVTDTATEGYYVVYLFHTSDPVVHLSLNQGTTRTRSEFKSATHDVLRERAQLIRRRLPDFAPRLPITTIDLGSVVGLPGDYAAGHAMGTSYSLSTLPSDEVLKRDLETAISAYKALTFRGGLDPTTERVSSLWACPRFNSISTPEMRELELGSSRKNCGSITSSRSCSTARETFRFSHRALAFGGVLAS